MPDQARTGKQRKAVWRHSVLQSAGSAADQPLRTAQPLDHTPFVGVDTKLWFAASRRREQALQTQHLLHARAEVAGIAHWIVLLEGISPAAVQDAADRLHHALALAQGAQALVDAQQAVYRLESQRCKQPWG